MIAAILGFALMGVALRRQRHGLLQSGRQQAHAFRNGVGPLPRRIVPE